MEMGPKMQMLAGWLETYGESGACEATPMALSGGWRTLANCGGPVR